MKDTTPQETEVLAIAKAAGLDRVIAAFKPDLFAAAKSAADARASFPAVEDAAREPWPPMRTGG